MDNKQLELSDFMGELETDPLTNSTCVILDGCSTNLTWRGLFDSKEYDTLSCVTYVSSPNFFVKSVGDFQNVHIIIGIEKEDVRKAFAESMATRLNNEGTKFFELLPESGKQKVLEQRMKIRFSKANSIIHSKFYLLSNSVNGNTRLITGSANLTQTAFDNSIQQYEDVIAFDNHPLFEIYQKRFEYLNTVTENYIPKEAIEKYKLGKMISMADYTPEERTDELIQILQRENIVPVCNESVLKYIQEAQSESEKEIIKTKTTFEVIASVGRKKRGDTSGTYILKTDKELEKARTKIIDILFRHTYTEAALQRFCLTYNDADKKMYHIFHNVETEQGREPEIYDRIASKEEIHDSIQNLLKFITAYQKFVTVQDADENSLSRIFEVIIYAFMSSYIFKIRQETSGSKSDIPIMLVIAGRAASGKSNLLAYVDRILTGRQLQIEQHYFQYKKIEKKNDISNLFLSDNTSPILVDEVPSSFFNSKASNKGEELIKYLSNTLDNKHPVMICTTNTNGFNIPSQVVRRIYFLKVDACFDEKYKAEANAYYGQVMEQANNLLFRDFCFRMGERIKQNIPLLSPDTSDYLVTAREIFMEYFDIAEVKIPDYFPKTPYNDYDSRGRNMWKTLYLQEKEKFIFTPARKGKEATLSINIKDIVSSKLDKDLYLNYLKPGVLVEESGVFTVLRANEFYKWIGVKTLSKWSFWKN